MALVPAGEGRSPLTAAALAKVPIITAPPGTSTRRQLDEVYAVIGRTPRRGGRDRAPRGDDRPGRRRCRGGARAPARRGALAGDRRGGRRARPARPPPGRPGAPHPALSPRPPRPCWRIALPDRSPTPSRPRARRRRTPLVAGRPGLDGRAGSTLRPDNEPYGPSRSDPDLSNHSPWSRDDAADEPAQPDDDAARPVRRHARGRRARGRRIGPGRRASASAPPVPSTGSPAPGTRPRRATDGSTTATVTDEERSCAAPTAASPPRPAPIAAAPPPSSQTVTVVVPPDRAGRVRRRRRAQRHHQRRPAPGPRRSGLPPAGQTATTPPPTRPSSPGS